MSSAEREGAEMECEICGKREAVCLIYIEGAQMHACAECANGNKILYYLSETDSGTSVPVVRRARTEEGIVEDYGKLIKAARMRMGLSLKELGLKIAEKANYLDLVEREVTLPSLTLARKLEKFLKIQLITSETNVHTTSSAPIAKKELTLLDIAEIERESEKKKK